MCNLKSVKTAYSENVMHYSSTNDNNDELYKLMIALAWECILIQKDRVQYIDGETLCPRLYFISSSWVAVKSAMYILEF